MPVTTPVKTIFNKCSLPISNKLHQVLIKRINQQEAMEHQSVTINFRDSSYSAEEGGFHPVEVSLQKDHQQRWSILYITDFAYMGNYYPELERSLDFDIGNSMAFVAGIGWQRITAYGVHDLYQVWESNFLSYFAMGAFDQIELTPL